MLQPQVTEEDARVREYIDSTPYIGRWQTGLLHFQELYDKLETGSFRLNQNINGKQVLQLWILNLLFKRFYLIHFEIARASRSAFLNVKNAYLHEEHPISHQQATPHTHQQDNILATSYLANWYLAGRVPRPNAQGPQVCLNLNLPWFYGILLRP